MTISISKVISLLVLWIQNLSTIQAQSNADFTYATQAEVREPVIYYFADFFRWGVPLGNCPAVLFSYFLLWICCETNPKIKISKTSRLSRSTNYGNTIISMSMINMNFVLVNSGWRKRTKRAKRRCTLRWLQRRSALIDVPWTKKVSFSKNYLCLCSVFFSPFMEMVSHSINYPKVVTSAKRAFAV